MNAEHWKSLILVALHRNRSDKGAAFLQLATVDRQNHPRNRTVVFRGFLEGTQTIVLATDSRSEKLDQLHHNPYAAICWYFSKTREQFRLTGKVAVVGPESTPYAIAAGEQTSPQTSHQQTRQQLWGRLSDSAKVLWYWPYPKGDRESSLRFPTTPPAAAIHPPDTFVLLLFEADEVDRLELNGTPQNRTIFSLSEDGWKANAVNP